MGKARHEANAAPRRALFRDKLGQRGSVAVEAAIIFPLLIMLSFGIIEFSLLMRDYTATNSVVRAGGRTASSFPADPDMITKTKKAMEQASSALPQDAYEELWIYRANANGLPVSTNCSSQCVKFAWNEAGDAFQQMPSSVWTRTAAACLEPNRAVGVLLKVEHTWVTGLFANTSEITERAVLAFEPITNASAATSTCW